MPQPLPTSPPAYDLRGIPSHIKQAIEDAEGDGEDMYSLADTTVPPTPTVNRPSQPVSQQPLTQQPLPQQPLPQVASPSLDAQLHQFQQLQQMQQQLNQMQEFQQQQQHQLASQQPTQVLYQQPQQEQQMQPQSIQQQVQQRQQHQMQPELDLALYNQMLSDSKPAGQTVSASLYHGPNIRSPHNVASPDAKGKRVSPVRIRTPPHTPSKVIATSVQLPTVDLPKNHPKANIEEMMMKRKLRELLSIQGQSNALQVAERLHALNPTALLAVMSEMYPQSTLTYLATEWRSVIASIHGHATIPERSGDRSRSVSNMRSASPCPVPSLAGKGPFKERSVSPPRRRCVDPQAELRDYVAPANLPQYVLPSAADLFNF
eukprot:TRINITY_DN14302_c0_g4_i1.p1 TRINITY_DN14302_c0_g4~~TRINITY_DN14302_c0_g4_i1.p1  ORF type:complete len:374 (+),score=92.38 TRINITY_DN14302_c0_g4_i1:2-1123(+)